MAQRVQIVGLSMGERQTTDLVVNALVMAWHGGNPTANSSITLIADLNMR